MKWKEPTWARRVLIASISHRQARERDRDAVVRFWSLANIWTTQYNDWTAGGNAPQEVNAIQEKAKDDGLVALVLKIIILLLKRPNKRVCQVRGGQCVVSQGCIDIMLPTMLGRECSPHELALTVISYDIFRQRIPDNFSKIPPTWWIIWIIGYTGVCSRSSALRSGSRSARSWSSDMIVTVPRTG
jgi:hypothetical protein